MANSRRMSRREKVILVAILAVVPPAAAYGLLEYQHWHEMYGRPKGPPSIGPDHPPGPETFTPGHAVDEQPAITKIEIVTGEDAAKRVEDDEMVIGVVIDGKARAYPLNMMTEYKREVFNDELAGRPIAATW